MKIRSFRAYGEREDLQAVFEEFQNRLGIYYVPTYSDIGEIVYRSITDIKNVGVNFHGSHIGSMLSKIGSCGNLRSLIWE